jgi:hypothetical protein
MRKLLDVFEWFSREEVLVPAGGGYSISGRWMLYQRMLHQHQGMLHQGCSGCGVVMMALHQR